MSEGAPGSETDHIKREVIEHGVYIDEINKDRRDIWTTITELRNAINASKVQMGIFQGIGIAINAILIYYFTKHGG